MDFKKKVISTVKKVFCQKLIELTGFNDSFWEKQIWALTGLAIFAGVILGIISFINSDYLLVNVTDIFVRWTQMLLGGWFCYVIISMILKIIFNNANRRVVVWQISKA